MKKSKGKSSREVAVKQRRKGRSYEKYGHARLRRGAFPEGCSCYKEKETVGVTGLARERTPRREKKKKISAQGILFLVKKEGHRSLFRAQEKKTSKGEVENKNGRME